MITLLSRNEVSSLLFGTPRVLLSACSISSFGDRPNTYEEVSEYFRAHFIQTHKRKDVSNRVLYTVRVLLSLGLATSLIIPGQHFTSMLDIRATQAIIINGT